MGAGYKIAVSKDPKEMITEKEFNLLRVIKENPFIKLKDFSSDEEFDYMCELAKELLKRDIIRTQSTNPFVINNTGHGPRYGIAGKFHLSTRAKDIIELENYSAYVKAVSKSSKWSMANRLAALAIVVTLLGVVVTLMVGK